MAKSKRKHLEPNWNGLTPWIELKTPLTTECCDCGLVHDFIFKVEKAKIYWRAKRNKKETLIARKIRKLNNQ